MSEPLYEALIRHEAFFAYDDFFYDLAKPECQGCPVLNQITTSFALDVLYKLAKTNREGTSFEGLDYTNEGAVLAEIQPRFIKQIAHCPGPQLIDRDLEETKARLEKTGIFTPEFLAKSLECHVPLKEDCSLHRLDDAVYPQG